MQGRFYVKLECNLIPFFFYEGAGRRKERALDTNCFAFHKKYIRVPESKIQSQYFPRLRT